MESNFIIEKLKGEDIVVNGEWLTKNDSLLLNHITKSKQWGNNYAYPPMVEEIVIEVKFNNGNVEYYLRNIYYDSNDKVKSPSKNKTPFYKCDWDCLTEDVLNEYYKKLKVNNNIYQIKIGLDQDRIKELMEIYNYEGYNSIADFIKDQMKTIEDRGIFLDSIKSIREE